MPIHKRDRNFQQIVSKLDVKTIPGEYIHQLNLICENGERIAFIEEDIKSFEGGDSNNNNSTNRITSINNNSPQSHDNRNSESHDNNSSNIIDEGNKEFDHIYPKFVGILADDYFSLKPKFLVNFLFPNERLNL